jgi:hypothetical protein
VFVLVILALITILGCSSSGDNLAVENKKIKDFIPNAQIPDMQGLLVKEVVVNIDQVNKENPNNLVIISYTSKKGKKDVTLNTNNDTKIIYGPYAGDKVITLSISKLDVEFNNEMDTTNMYGLELLYSIKNDHVLIYTQHKGISYSSEGRLNDKYTLDKQLEVFSMAISNL